MFHINLNLRELVKLVASVAVAYAIVHFFGKKRLKNKNLYVLAFSVVVYLLQRQLLTNYEFFEQKDTDKKDEEDDKDDKDDKNAEENDSDTVEKDNDVKEDYANMNHSSHPSLLNHSFDNGLDGVQFWGGNLSTVENNMLSPV